MQQLTKEQAIAFSETNDWRNWSPTKLAAFQLQQDKLCIPFSDFHRAVEKALDRPVYTHEFGLNRSGLLAELKGEASAPTLDEIIGMLPAEKLVIMHREDFE